MIELQGVSFGYTQAHLIFDHFDWQVAAGESWAVLGPSGCGKSTLLYLLAGLHQPFSGQVLVGGMPVVRPRPNTGLILQDYGLLPWQTLSENIMLGLRVRQFYGPDGVHAPVEDKAANIAELQHIWLERMGLESVGDQYPAQVSGGQRQRAAIARTLALNPDLLLMDEPFASLDAPTRESLQRFVMQMHGAGGMTMLIVTHSVEEAALLGRKILLLGNPPNRQTQVILNLAAGNSDYLNTPAYLEICARLRQELGAAV
ncbi:MAG: ABC transporter ATP-binding protein [Chloroflexota bacterium]